MPLANCGGVTDNFDTFPTGWQHFGTTSNPSNNAGLQINANNSFAAAWIQLPSVIGDECASTIDLDDQPASGGVFLNVKSGINSLDIDYYDSTHTVSAAGVNVSVPGKPKSIGIALTGGQVYYIYHSQGAWHIVGSGFARPLWMAFPPAPTIGFGVVTQQQAQLSAAFDNFNIPSISPQDIGL